MKFIKEFDDERSAIAFAAEKGAKITVQYKYKPYYGLVKKYLCIFRVL